MPLGAAERGAAEAAARRLAAGGGPSPSRLLRVSRVVPGAVRVCDEPGLGSGGEKGSGKETSEFLCHWQAIPTP